jgi:GNAT superfamily N-acetyltransferase
VPATDLQRITAFRLSFARRQASVVSEVPGGVAVFDPQYAASHEHNQLIIDYTQAPGQLATLADKALGHLPYRRITILDDATATACAPGLTADDYAHDTELVMTHSGTAPLPGSLADPVTVPELRPALIHQLCAWMPQASDAVIYQLADRRTARLRGADQVRFLAARDETGTIVSWADLYLDPAQGIAQIEDVMTAEAHTRRGYADTVLATALREAAGCGLVFLLAEAGDWPRTWYARRGFTPIGRSHVFTRTEAIALTNGPLPGAAPASVRSRTLGYPRLAMCRGGPSTARGQARPGPRVRACQTVNCSPEEMVNMTDNDPPRSTPTEEPGTAQPAEDAGYLTEDGQAVGEDGSVVPIIGGLPAVEGSSWDIGAPAEDRGAGLAEELGSAPDQASHEDTPGSG